jgi:putative transposase
MLAEGVSCGLHRIERLMRLQALKARPRRRRLPPYLGERQVATVAPNVLDRSFDAPAPNRKWIADFTYVWRAGGNRQGELQPSAGTQHSSMTDS